MKKFFISSRNIISLVAIALIASVSSCDKTGPDGEDNLPIDEETPDAVLTLVDSLVEVSYEGGVFSVAYTLENPVEGVSVNAVSEQDFVGNFDYSADGVISFTVAENIDTLARSTDIEVSYGTDIREYFIVNQDAAPVPDYKLTIVFNDENKANPTMYVDPIGADPAQPYMANALSILNIEEQLKFDIENPGLEIIQWWQSSIDASIESYMARGYSLTDAVAASCRSMTGNSEVTYVALKGGIDHIAFVCQVDMSTGKLQGNLTMVEFTNGLPPMEGNEYKIEVSEVTSTTAKCTITSTDAMDGFIAGTDMASKWEGMLDEDILLALCAPYYDWHQWSVYTGTAVISCTGLTPEEDYVVFAYSSANGCPTTDLFKYKFTTLAE